MRGSRWRAAVMLTMAACGPLDAPVTSDPVGQLDRICSDNRGCPRDSFCEKSGCLAPQGKCVRRPVSGCEGTAKDPVCGCAGLDQVTFFNDCVRQLSGASLSARGECLSGTECVRQEDCPPPAVCARLGSACAEVSGRCWVVPPTCPGVGAWTSCANPQVCVDLCTAVRTQQPFEVADSTCR